MIRCVQPRSTSPSTPWLSWTPPSTSSTVRSSKSPGTTHGREAAREAGRGGDRAAEREVLARPGSVLPRRPLEDHVLVDVLAGGLVGRPLPRRLAHVHRLEAPVVAGVERGRLEQQDRDGRLAPRVLDVGVEGAGVPFRLDQQVAHRDPAAALGPAAPGLGVEAPLVQRADPVGARVGRQRHPEVLEQVGPAGAAHVARRGLAVLLLDRADELDVVAVGDLRVRLRLEQVLDVEVVERADDRAAGDGRDHLHRAQQAELGEPREDADVEERRAVAAPGEGKAELRMLPFLGHWRRAHDVTELGASQRESRLTHAGS